MKESKCSYLNRNDLYFFLLSLFSFYCFTQIYELNYFLKWHTVQCNIVDVVKRCKNKKENKKKKLHQCLTAGAGFDKMSERFERLAQFQFDAYYYFFQIKHIPFHFMRCSHKKCIWFFFCLLYTYNNWFYTFDNDTY